DRLFPVRGELGPVLRDRRVRVEATLLDEPVAHDGGDALGRRERDDQRVALPHVGDDASVDRQRARGTDVSVLAEVRRERVGHAPEAVVDVAVHGGHRPPPPLALAPRPVYAWPCNRASVASASAMIRSMSSATVGSSSITPTTWPVGRIPTSALPSTIVAFVSIGAFAASATWLHFKPCCRA